MSRRTKRVYNPYAQKDFERRKKVMASVLSGRWSAGTEKKDEAGLPDKDRELEKILLHRARYGTEIKPKPEVKFEYMLEYKGLKVILTNHARQQLARRRDLAIERQKAWFIAAIDGLEKQNWKPNMENHEIFIYSKAMKQGFIVAFRRDYKADLLTSHQCMVIVTAYPKGRRKGMHSDTEVVYV